MLLAVPAGATGVTGPVEVDVAGGATATGVDVAIPGVGAGVAGCVGERVAIPVAGCVAGVAVAVWGLGACAVASAAIGVPMF